MKNIYEANVTFASYLSLYLIYLGWIVSDIAVHFDKLAPAGLEYLQPQWFRADAKHFENGILGGYGMHCKRNY